MSKSGSFTGFVVLALGAAGLAAGLSVRRPEPSLEVEEPRCCCVQADTCTVVGDTVVVRIIGDVMLHRGQLEDALCEDSTYVFDTYLEGIREDLMNADLAIANMEFSLGGKPYAGYPKFSAPDSYADYVAGCGVDVFLMANNHILDRDTLGLHRTLDYYDSLGVFYTGVRSISDSLCVPLYLDVRGFRLALVNFTYGTNLPNRSGELRVNRMRRDEIMRAISAARDSADLVVALPHWGEEYELRHNEAQGSWAREMAEAGADVVVGAHPHVVQDSSIVLTSDGRRVPVYYSIGNAVSNMSARNTQLELMVSLSLVRGDGGRPEMAVDHQWLWCTRPQTMGRSFQTVKLSDCLDGGVDRYQRSVWVDSLAYDRMVSNYRAVRDSLYRR